MKKWLETFFTEKNINLDETFEVQGDSGTNFFTYEVIIESILNAAPSEQRQIKDILIKIDFRNGDVKDFLKHLAKALAL